MGAKRCLISMIVHYTLFALTLLAGKALSGGIVHARMARRGRRNGSNTDNFRGAYKVQSVLDDKFGATLHVQNHLSPHEFPDDNNPSPYYAVCFLKCGYFHICPNDGF